MHVHVHIGTSNRHKLSFVTIPFSPLTSSSFLSSLYPTHSQPHMRTQSPSMIPNPIPPLPNSNPHIRKRINLQPTTQRIPNQPCPWRVPINRKSRCLIVSRFDGKGILPVYGADVAAVVVCCAVDFGDPHGDWGKEYESCCCGEEVDLEEERVSEGLGMKGRWVM